MVGSRLRWWRKGADDLIVPEPPPMFREEGSFAYGICDTCDWRGPGRRARTVAERDADLHRLAGCGINITEPLKSPSRGRS